MSNTIGAKLAKGLHPGANEINERFETWWNDEGERIATDWGVKQAAQTAWHNGAYVAVSKCSSLSDILLTEVTIEADK